MSEITIIAVIGNESHTTSSGWAKLTVNGQRLSHREAISKEWLTKFGDKHASWCECIFKVEEGAKVEWQVGANRGSRGSERVRQNLVFVADSSIEPIETEGIGYPASEAVLRGRLRLVADEDKEAKRNHEALKEAL